MAKKHHRVQQRAATLAAGINAATDAARIAGRTKDGFQNFTARVGLGAGSQQDGANFGFNFVTRNRIQMEAAYRGNWVCGVTVDVVAEDMTRAGITINSTIEPDLQQKLDGEFDRLEIWNQLCDTVKWSRLYGGCIAVLLIDGQNVSTPLNLNSIAKDQFKGLLVLDRWLVQPSLQNLVTEMGPDLGKPKFYRVVADAQALVNMDVHYSRVIRLEGVTLPYWQRIAENGWGQSVLERMWDRIVAFDSTTEGAAQLVYKAHLRTIKIKGLRDIIGTGGKAYEALVKNIEMIRQFQSNEGMTLLDGDDEFETTSYTFAGLDDMLHQFGQQLSGATQIPLIRLFGQSPTGLNATGESDLRTYYDNVTRSQDRQLRTGVAKILDVTHRSLTGKPPPADLTYNFAPLYDMDDTEKATVVKTKSDAIVNAFVEGIITKATALRELKALGETTDVFTNISDEEITEAENEPPPPTEMDMLEAQVAAKAAVNKAAGAAPGAQQEQPA